MITIVALIELDQKWDFVSDLVHQGFWLDRVVFVPFTTECKVICKVREEA